MILRVTRGVVAAGREAEFAAICRRQVSDLGRAPGLAAFLSGYRRIDGTDQYILAATWDSEDAAVQAAGAQDKPKVVERLDGVASVDSFEVYDLIEPAFRGMVDAPGGVVRFSTGRVSIAGRARFLAWLRNPPRDKAQQIQRLMLGWAIGERHAPDGESVEVVAVTAWPSPLVIEAIAEPGRQGAPLYAEMDEFAIDFHVDQYRALALDLPDDMADIGSRRVIAARFAARSAAEATAASLRAAMASSPGVQVSVAPLGAPGSAASDGTYILVARVAINENARAERLIADQGGDVILSRREAIDGTELGQADGRSSSPLNLARGLSAAE